MIYDENYEPDLDDLTREELAELGMPGDVARVLDGWLLEQHRVISRRHGVGSFLDALAAQGYRVTPIAVPAFDELLPAPTE